jgi:hypothetical protein
MRKPRFSLGALLALGLVAAALPPSLHAAPSFSVTSANVTPNPVSPGVTATVTIGVKNGGTLVSAAIVDMEIFDSANRLVLQQYIPGQTFATGETKSYDWFWTVPGNQPAGSYTVKVGAFADGWAKLYMWNNSATTFAVQGGPVLPVAFSVGTIAADPVSMARGGTVSITAQVTATGQGNGSGIIVMLYLLDPLGREFPGSQQVLENQAFAAGQTRTFSFQWKSPGNAAQGTYSAAIGVFSGSWSEMYVWNTNNQAFAVGTAVDPTFTITGTTVSPNPVGRGQSVTVTAVITNTSQIAATNIIVLGEYNDPARNIDQQYVSGLSFAAGQKHTVTFVFPVAEDLPPGPYTVDVGVFNRTWSKLYTWGFELETFDVR